MMTVKIYKNEYKASHLEFIRKRFEVIEENENTLTVAGAPAELEKLMDAMYATDERFKSLFSAFVTAKERAAYSASAVKKLGKDMLDTLCKMASHGEVNAEFQALTDIYNKQFSNY